MGLWEKTKGMLSGKVDEIKKGQEKERARRLADDMAYKAELGRAEGRARKDWARKKALETAKSRYVKPSSFGGGGRPADINLPSLDLFGSSGGGGHHQGGPRKRRGHRRDGYGGGGSILDF